MDDKLKKSFFDDIMQAQEIPNPAHQKPIIQLDERKNLTQIGHYRIEKKIGSGGYGTTYLAVDLNSEALGNRKHVVIKVLHENKAQNQEVLKRFVLEQRILDKLDHPNIPTTFTSGEYQNFSYYVTKYLKGSTLDEFITHRAKNPRKMRNEKHRTLVLNIALEILDALNHAHNNNIVHRDIKPENIIVDLSTPLRPRVHVIDWGIATLEDKTEESSKQYKPSVIAENKNDIRLISRDSWEKLSPKEKTNRLKVSGILTKNEIGTPGYMSPEQAECQENIDRRSDIYSFGLLLIEMLTGKPQFKGTTYNKALALFKAPDGIILKSKYKIPERLNSIIATTTRKNPKDRYNSAEEAQKDIVAYLHNETISVYKDKVYDKISRIIRKNPNTTLLGIFTLVGVLLAIMALFHFEKKQKKALKLASLKKEKIIKLERHIKEEKILYYQKLFPLISKINAGYYNNEDIEVLNNIIKVSPRREAYYCRAKIYQGKSIKLIKHNPDKSKYLFKKAVHDFKKAIQISNKLGVKYTQAIRSLASMYLDNNDNKKAMYWYKKGADFTSNSDFHEAICAIYYLILKKEYKKILLLEHNLIQGKKHWRLINAYAESILEYCQTSGPTKFEKNNLYHKIINLNNKAFKLLLGESGSGILYGLSIAKKELGYFEEAIIDIKKLLDLQNNYKNNLRLGYLLFLIKEYKEALKYLIKACNTENKYYADALYYTAKCHRKLGNKRQAKKYFLLAKKTAMDQKDYKLLKKIEKEIK